jgi:tetratricopeptide (TPR) repeat protein
VHFVWLYFSNQRHRDFNLAAVGRVEAWIALEKYQEATAALDVLQAGQPKFPHYQYLRALILFQKAEAARKAGDSRKSEEWLEKAWQSHPDSLYTGLSLIQLDLQQQETDSALALAQQLKN